MSSKFSDMPCTNSRWLKRWDGNCHTLEGLDGRDGHILATVAKWSAPPTRVEWIVYVRSNRRGLMTIQSTLLWSRVAPTSSSPSGCTYIVCHTSYNPMFNIQACSTFLALSIFCDSSLDLPYLKTSRLCQCEKIIASLLRSDNDTLTTTFHLLENTPASFCCTKFSRRATTAPTNNGVHTIPTGKH